LKNKKMREWKQKKDKKKRKEGKSVEPKEER
jgi:hypothetical protein